MTKNDILDGLWRNPFIDEVIRNITGGHPLSNELRSELFLILLEMPEAKIKTAHQAKWINYLVINIIKKMWNSKTSPFYLKWKKREAGEITSDIALEDGDVFPEDLLTEVMKVVDTLPFVEKELFLMRYKIGKYDRWLGDLRDSECKKPIYSYRKIELRLQIGGVKIDHSTIEVYHKKTIKKIRKELKDFNIY